MYICGMEYGENILKRIKSALGRQFHRLISINKFDDLNHKVIYIELDYYNNEPRFSIRHAFFDFKVELRDSRIDFLLLNKKEDLEETFDVESIIYSEEQRQVLDKLRQSDIENKSVHRILEEVKIEYSKSFNVGDTVYYNNYHGIITFKHQYKSGNQLWSVKTGDTEHRYIKGTLLRKRKVEDLSNIPIDKELDRLSTEKLLKMYKRSLVRNQGIGDKRIKRILNEREHVQKGETKIINHSH
jgi:hypothetical protein